jgi:hypothetical protein
VKPAGYSTSFPFPLDTLTISAASLPLGFEFPANRPEGSGVFTPGVGPSLSGFGPWLNAFEPSLNVFGPSLDGFGPSLGVFNGNFGDVTEPSDLSTPIGQGIFPVLSIPTGPIVVGGPFDPPLDQSGPNSCLNPPCPVVAIGRPFVAADGLEITSDASVCDAWHGQQLLLLQFQNMTQRNSISMANSF